ncbi:DUF1127 domain-containing protein [Roseovarius autotrophicus]|uniref:DUF1127 domain-containing protein n=1 Tax=Roseovarius autotrophicus TaxID=2824121 RepID=UPI001A0CCD90|nr:DUF1127 domain-containing protein [Roseovarius autotrophicus]MBE0454961.1 DUF1127 domain-containing protein [Roseovarius sp.]
MALLDTTRAHAHSRATPGFFARLLGTLLSWSDRRATRKALSRLSDRELDDIGLCRGDIDVIVRRF